MQSISPPKLSKKLIRDLADAANTDVGNAECLHMLLGDNVVYDYRLDSWLSFNGTIWNLNESGEILRYIIKMVRARKEAALRASNMESLKWAIRSESAARVSATERIAKPLFAFKGEWNANNHLLGTPNGVVDLRDGSVTKDKETYVTTSVNAQYNEKAKCPKFEKFLDDIFPDEEVREYFSLSIGEALIKNSSQRIHFCVGDGGNGKTTLFRVLRYVLGDYVKWTTGTAFVEQRRGDMRNDLAFLNNSRIAVSVEPESSAALSTSTVKAVTGGDPLVVRYMYKDFFEMNADFTPFILTNTLPPLHDTSYAMSRRLSVIPFEQTFTKPDINMYEKLILEADGILMYLVNYAIKAYNKSGAPETPKKSVEWLDSWIRESDTILGFVTNCCVMRDDAKIKVEELREAYYDYCDPDKTTTKNALGRRLKKLGIGHERIAGVYYYTGITLKS